MVQNLTDLAHGGGGVIVPPGGGTGVEDHHVTFFRRLLQRIPDQIIAVRHDGISHRHRVPFPQHGGEDGGIEFQNIPGLRIGTGRDDLIACGDDGDTRAADDLQLTDAARDHSSDGGGADLHEAGQNHFTGADILADLADMLPGGGGGMDGDTAVVVLQDVLHHDHRVTALRNGIAGVHHNKLPRPERHRRGLGGAEAVLRVQGHAVHGAGGIVGGIDAGVYGFRGDAAVCVRYRDRLCFSCKAVFLQLFQIVFLCLIQRNIGQIFKSHFKSPFLIGSLSEGAVAKRLRE